MKKRKIRNESAARRTRRHLSIRRRLIGTPERPRVCVYRSNAHIYAQIIDDTTGRTLASVSSLGLDPSALAAPPTADDGKKKGKAKGGKAPGRKTLQARAVGRLLAETAKEKGIGMIAFDRAGYLFHGRVAALAQAARESGLDF